MGSLPAAPQPTRETLPVVRVSGANVQAMADLVRVHLRRAPTGAAWDDPMFWNVEDSRDDRCQFLAIGNAINFRFWSLVDGEVIPAKGRVDGVKLRGSMYLWRRLRTSILRSEFSLDANFLAGLTPESFRRAFADDDGRCPLEPGLEERVLNLQDLGRELDVRWEGKFARLLDAARGSFGSFTELCATFRAFDDPVQKLTMVNAIMLVGSGLAAFDREPLPGIDYHLVKQAVRQGLVTPTGTIKKKLASRALLSEQESLALRRATLSALVQVAHRAKASTVLLDNLYWLNRRVCTDDTPACQQEGGLECPFEAACEQRTQFGLPLEITRYY